MNPVIAREDQILLAVLVQIGREHLHGAGSGQTKRRLRIHSLLRPPVDERLGFEVELVAIIGHDQIGPTVFVQIGCDNGHRRNPHDAVLPCGIRKLASRGAQINAGRHRLAGVVVIGPRRGKDQVEMAVVVDVQHRDVVGAHRGQIGPLGAQPVGRAPVHIRRKLRRDAVFAIGDDQVRVAVLVQVDNATHPAAVGGHLLPPPTFSVLASPKHSGRPSLDVVMVIGQDQINISVSVDIERVNQLDRALGVDVQVASAVVESALDELFEPTMHQHVLVRLRRFARTLGSHTRRHSGTQQ